jgi:RNA polymerase sigma factor (sigma-70 family)
MPGRITALLARTLQQTKVSASVPDCDLLRQYAETGDQAAFAAVVDRHAAMVLGVCRRLLPADADAEDACQAVFLILCRKAKSLLWQASVANWLYTAARKVAHNARVAAARRTRREQAAAVPVSVAPTERLTGQELLAVLEEELDRLPRRYREPLVLCYLEGLTRDEAAARQGVPLATLKSQLERGRKKLAEAVAARGYALGLLLLATAATSRAQALAPRLFQSILSAARGAPSPAVAALAQEVAMQTLRLKLKLAALALTAIIVVSAGLGAYAKNGDRHGDLPSQSPFFGVTDEPAPAQDDKPPPGTARKVDRFGDPLPAGAVIRLGTLGFRQSNLVAIGFRKSGELVAFSEDLAVHVWPADGRPEVATTLLLGKKEYAWRRAMSADGRFAAGFLTGSKLVVWDIAGDKPAEYVSREVQDVYKLTFSPNGEWLAVNEADRNAKDNLLLCHLPTKEWSALAVGEMYIESLSFTPDGKALAVANSQGVVVIDTAQKSELLRVTVPKERPAFAALSPDGTKLAFLPMKWLHGPEPVLRLFSVETGQERKAFKLLAAPVRWVAFSPDGKRIWTGGPRSLCEWDPSTGKLVRQVAGPGDHPPAFSPDGSRLAAHSESAVLLWDVKQGKVHRPDLVDGGHTAPILGLTISPDGQVIATNALDGEIRLWEASTGRPLGRALCSWGRGPRITFMPDSRSFLAVADDYVTPVLFDAANGKELRRFEVPAAVAKKETTSELRLSGDARTLTTHADPVTSDEKSYTVRWEVSTGKVIDRTEVQRNLRDELTMPGRSPDGRWEVKMGAVRRLGEGDWTPIVPANETLMLRAHFSADSRFASIPRARLNSSAADRNLGSLVIYDLNAKAVVIELPTGRPLRHAFAPGGRQVAVFGPEEIALWDLPSGKKVWRVPSEHGSTIRDETMMFTPGGRRLITGHDCTALVWDITRAPRGDDAGPAKLSAKELAKLWDTLAGDDAVKAYRAEWQLVDQPRETLTVLRERLKPAKAVEAATVRPLIARLDADEFADREAGWKALLALGEAAVPALRQALKGKLSAEQKKRIEQALTAAMAPAAVLTGDALRQVRAISVLERVATPDALTLLAELAAGNPEARLTREAAAASARVNQILRER